MPKINVTIRNATSHDAELLASIGERAFSQSFAADNTPDNMARYLAESFSPEKQAQELAQPGSLFLIAESEGNAIGYARLLAGSTETCITGDRPIELVRIYILQGWQHVGAGSQLMQACLNEARSRGHDIIWLGVWEKNLRAIAFYQKWGFVKVGTHRFLLGDDMQVDWVMQREVSQEKGGSVY